MPDPINPGDPGFQPPQPPKRINPEDIFDAARFQQQLSESLNKAFKNIDLSQLEKARGIMQSISKEASKVEISDISKDLIASRESVSEAVKKEKAEEGKWEDQILKRVSTAERYKHQQLLKEKNELIKKVKDLGIVELNNLKGTTKDKEKLKEAEKTFEILQHEKVQKVEKSYNEEVKKAAVDAAASEGNLGAKLQQSWGNLLQKTKDYGKSIFSSNSLLEAGLILLNESVNQTGEIAKTQAGMRAAGLAGTGTSTTGIVGKPGELEGFGKALDGIRIQANLTETDVMNLVRGLALAPRTLKEVQQTGGKTLTSFVGAMGSMGIGVNESTELIATASNSFNLSIKGMNNVFKDSYGVAKASGMNFKDVFNAMLRLNGQLRGLTLNTKAAQSVLFSTIKPLKDIGASNVEVQQFADSLGNMLGQLTPSKLAGLVALRTGEMPTRTGLLEGAEKSMETVVGAFKPVLDSMEKGSTERLLATQKLAEQFGISAGTTVQGAQRLETLIDQFGTGSAKDMEDTFKKFRDAFKTPETKFQDLQTKGFQTLVTMDGPLKALEKGLIGAVQQLAQSGVPLFNDLMSIMPGIKATLAPANVIGRMFQRPEKYDVKLTLDDLNKPGVYETMLNKRTPSPSGVKNNGN